MAAPAQVSSRPSSFVSDVVVGLVEYCLNLLAAVGSFTSFSAKALAAVPSTLAKYRNECLRQLSDIAWGTGALIVGGGTIGVMVLLAISVGTSLGIEGFNGLELVGLSPLVGFISATANTRELGPLVAALALASQVGCRFTAQIGSMKIHEEVDALEVMAVPPMNYLVTTRVLATMVAIVPLYLVGLIGSYIASQITVVFLFQQSPGQFDHYFSTFIQSKDVVFSVIKVVIFGLFVALIHTWYGFKVAGGPQAVGEATGKAIRASIVSVVVLDMVMTIVMWGGDPGFRISG
jgi:phospholipid/cholesterol/gamma-HCH transport system permease protein